MSRKSSADAFVVTTEDGSYDIVEANVLEMYAIKAEVDESGSKQLKTDGQEYDDALLEPLYDLQQLCEILVINTYHENCVDVVARDSAGVGYDIVPVTGENQKELNKPEMTYAVCRCCNRRLLHEKFYEILVVNSGQVALQVKTSMLSLSINDSPNHLTTL